LSSVVVTNEQDLVGIEFARTNLVMKIYNPANPNEWIDGAGNKYQITYSTNYFVQLYGGNPFPAGYPTGYGPFPITPATYEWNSGFSGFSGYPNKVWVENSDSGVYGWVSSEANPTNYPLVLYGILDAAPSTTCVVYRTVSATTNFVGNIGNATTATTVTGVQSNLIASASAHANRTDNPHIVTASQVGALTAQETTNAIAASMSGNLIVQLTTNKTLSYTFEPTNATYIGQCAETTLPAAGTVSVPIGAAGAYPLAWGCTNSTFTSVEGTYVNGQLFCAENEAGDITAKVEIYRRDIATDVMSEWGDGGATFTVPASATPQVVPYSVWVPSVDTNQFRVWARIKRVGGSATSARLLIVGSGSGTPTHFSMTVPATVPIASHNADASAHPALKAYRAPFATYTDLTGSITLTNNLEAPISISGTGSISVAFSGLVAPYPVYFTAQGFSSITFPAGSYLVGGGMWQTNRVNHFIVWQHSTNLFINPLLSTEIPE
jgi:hypothetical protein